MLVCGTSEELALAFERYPVLPYKVADSLADLAGAGIDITIKKD